MGKISVVYIPMTSRRMAWQAFSRPKACGLIALRGLKPEVSSHIWDAGVVYQDFSIWRCRSGQSCCVCRTPLAPRKERGVDGVHTAASERFGQMGWGTPMSSTPKTLLSCTCHGTVVGSCFCQQQTLKFFLQWIFIELFDSLESLSHISESDLVDVGSDQPVVDFCVWFLLVHKLRVLAECTCRQDGLFHFPGSGSHSKHVFIVAYNLASSIYRKHLKNMWLQLHTCLAPWESLFLSRPLMIGWGKGLEVWMLLD